MKFYEFRQKNKHGGASILVEAATAGKANVKVSEIIKLDFWENKSGFFMCCSDEPFQTVDKIEDLQVSRSGLWHHGKDMVSLRDIQGKTNVTGKPFVVKVVTKKGIQTFNEQQKVKN